MSDVSLDNELFIERCCGQMPFIRRVLCWGGDGVMCDKRPPHELNRRIVSLAQGDGPGLDTFPLNTRSFESG